MNDEIDSPEEPPFIGGHLPFGKMGITPPLEEMGMDL